MTSETPIAVPLDKAPLRPLGNLLGTLKLLQESFAQLWLVNDVLKLDSTGISEVRLTTIGQLIATAVQQAEALHKPEGDLAAWQEEAQITLAGLIDKLSMLVVGKVEAQVRNLAGELQVHLAVMPAQPDVNAELLTALEWTLKHSVGNNHMHSGFCPAGHGNSVKACRCGRDAIAAAKEGAPR